MNRSFIRVFAEGLVFGSFGSSVFEMAVRITLVSCDERKRTKTIKTGMIIYVSPVFFVFWKNAQRAKSGDDN